MAESPDDSTLLLRAFDSGDTYVSFRWLDRPDSPTVHRISSATRDRGLVTLDSALITTTGDDADPVRSALTGALVRPLSEFSLNARLADMVFPQDVRREIVERAARGRVTVRITPSRMLARMPFELAVIDDPRRLIEVVDVCYEPPATIHVGRARIPARWNSSRAARPTVYMIDPKLPTSSGLGQVLGRINPYGLPTNAEAFVERIRSRPRTSFSGVGKVVDRWDLSDDLRDDPGRLVYFGHVSSTLDEPGSASLHLSDDANEPGYTDTVNQAHRPLSALDLMLGTAFDEVGEAPESGPGHVIWPMPPRVAIIACEGGVDYRSSETFGLVMAMFNSGAELVTTTRWTLPSDSAFEKYASHTAIPGPTTELALAVDETHEAADPVQALAQWQRRKLAVWRDNPGPATSPLTWAAAACHVCPPREVHPPRYRS
ncbi:CHAT domain-containing protein [Gordonia sp. (in: high G+C Gram-positive bacteria)]|uniref:CHAT domain-containing protein n=1 Tax=Gordonia sp. (in: high G+C Gram-positive bacteria) TaxID=84139 RepID=UPI001D8C19ED|nr:CHAT domain-containing protein [Gordonia sp. (in: high G+C Gram-positive bacteria)]MCB1294212.1 CHAT domain-containing protein [Gordonia sp. (in: high G+C Gram-positive bacteria)]HMS75896.1 CHAT domain-containing protein [Gordonia sp. (in: high G+C Gram-positive bacteria)]HQV17627.1 CHAT domain-containing protein [Gordonia sp. (in: high G+C Gram-positive bacteria)]